MIEHKTPQLSPLLVDKASPQLWTLVLKAKVTKESHLNFTGANLHGRHQASATHYAGLLFELRIRPRPVLAHGPDMERAFLWETMESSWHPWLMRHVGSLQVRRRQSLCAEEIAPLAALQSHSFSRW